MTSTPRSDFDPTAAPLLLQRLQWQLRHATTTLLSGGYRSVFRGRGIEFDQVVRYNWGDDLRDIDWNVTARLGEPYRKKFVEERELCVLLVVEDSPVLQFGSATRTRRETLLEAAALLVLLGLRQRDRVGVLYTSPQETWFRRPAAGREAALHSASRLLEQPVPELDAGVETTVPWRLALRAAPRHSVLVWLGPFTPGVEPEEWRALQNRYHAIGLRADDPWDRELPALRRVRAFDPAAGAVAELDLASPANRAAHARWTTARDEYFEALFPDARDRHVLPGEGTVLESLLGYFQRCVRPGTPVPAS